ncbi:MAG: hypothetical protein ACLUJG_01580 [Lawsonibacter sp.]
MSVEEPKRTLAYICPACRQSVIVERDVFALAAAPAHIKCPCGKSELSVEFMPQRVRLSVPCVYCGREHLVSCPSHAFLRERALAFSCTASGLDCCYVGEEGPVFAATARLEQAADKLKEEQASRGESRVPGSRSSCRRCSPRCRTSRPGEASPAPAAPGTWTLTGELQLRRPHLRPVRRPDAHPGRYRGRHRRPLLQK